MPGSPARPPELPARTGATGPTASRPTIRQIWVRAVVIAAVFGLFVAVGFGRWEAARSLTIFVVATLIVAVVLGALFTWLNRGTGRTGPGLKP